MPQAKGEAIYKPITLIYMVEWEVPHGAQGFYNRKYYGKKNNNKWWGEVQLLTS
jgi:hypothetical protein